MIQPNELRIGNLVFWKPKLLRSTATMEPMQIELIEILPDKVGYLSPTLEHRVEPFEDALIANEPSYEPLEELEPIPLTDEWRMKLSVATDYPKWIRYVHELQNWYFWNHNKNELTIKD